MADAKTILTGVVLKQGGKVVEGEPVKDNYAVYPKAGSPLAAVSGSEILKTLSAAYPACAFTFCAKPAEDTAESQDGEKKRKPKGDDQGGK